jgi:hypothetical protein
VTRPWLDLGATLHLRAAIAGPLFLDLSGGVLVAAFEDRVYLSPDITVYAVPPVGGRAEVAIGIEFR